MALVRKRTIPTERPPPVSDKCSKILSNSMRFAFVCEDRELFVGVDLNAVSNNQNASEQSVSCVDLLP
jgi:hypothetical protein